MNAQTFIRAILISSALTLAALRASADLDFVGDLNPPAGNSISFAFPATTSTGIQVDVFKFGVTEGAGQGAGITCTVVYGKAGETPTQKPMNYSGDSGNNDRYAQILILGELTPGNYEVSVWCSDDGGATQMFNEGGFMILTMTLPPTPPPGNVLVQLFEWKYSDVGQECVALAGSGYTGVQVSSPAEHKSHLTVAGNPWWVRYQPVSYLLGSRSGTAQEFADMVAACDAAGIDVIVDVVLNHMADAGLSALGTVGTFYFADSYNFSGSHGPADFHYCGTDPGGSQQHDLFNVTNRFEVQNCELDGLADIDTTAAAPRGRMIAYLQGLLDLGVDGFRIDAAKHILSSDIEAILAALSGSPYIVQEVRHMELDQVRDFEYRINGDTTLFGFGSQVGSAFLNCGADLSDLDYLITTTDDTNDDFVFTDNHDTQRESGCIASYQSGPAYDLANIFMLALPYGYPRVMSSYYFADYNQGPPSTDGIINDVWIDGEHSGCNATDWVCEHRRPALKNAARLRMLAQGEPVTDRWDDGGNRLAFGRSDRGYVAMNNAGTGINRTWSTSMAAGTYCNLSRYNIAGSPPTCRYPDGDFPAPTAELIEIDDNGDIANLTIPAFSALVVHAQGQVVIADLDGDSVPDDMDNCLLVGNATQLDSDGDGFGNRCDADLNNDGVVNLTDLGLLRVAFFATPAGDNWNAAADFNGDSVVNSVDLGILRSRFFGAPGPGAQVPPVPPVCGAPDTGIDPTQAFGDVMFLRGDLVGDSAALLGVNDFINLGNDQYLLELPLIVGSFSYKVANAGWSIQRSNITDVLTGGGQVTLEDNGGGSPDGDIAVSANGCYAFTLDASDTDSPELSMVRKF